MSIPWSDIEIELIIADYFAMLRNQLADVSYNKTGHRRNLLPFLNNRTEGSIEFKHQNISAVLINLGQPYIKGYLPRFNYQAALYDKVVSYFENDSSIVLEFEKFVDSDIVQPSSKVIYSNLIEEAPNLGEMSESSTNYKRNPVKINYLEREQKNCRLGFLGEELVLSYEKWNLIKQGKNNLADSVEWISNDQGDGAGFDILSRNLNGTDKYIEVKTTRLRKETPFYFTRNELQFSIENSDNYHLYRLFNFENKMGMFIKNGSFDKICHHTPMSYKGYF